MKQPDVDTEKIVKHIEYTKHWLDKANKNFQEKSFSNGSMVLNLARAELTAAWEEAMQLKSQVFTQLPRKAKANWKPITSVGLLASGFLIAVFLIQFMNTEVPQPGRVRAVQVAPVVIEQPMAVRDAAMSEPKAEDITMEPADRTTAPVKKARPKPAPQAAPAPDTVSEPVAVAEPVVLPAPVITEPESLPFTPLVVEPAVKKDETAKREAELDQSKVIEMMKAAERSLYNR